VARRSNAVHALVNCQMHAEMANVDDLTLEVWERSLRINLTAPLFATKAFLPLLRAAGDAAVVHLGSVDGSMGNPRLVAYSAAKGGLVPLTHVMAHQLGADGIRVNCVARALVAAPPPDPPLPPHVVAYTAGIEAQTPLQRSATLAEIGSVVAFLCSPAAGYVTGTVLRVDGGRCTITPGTA
jgi:NAD(P)-dependent dehydrogenase (short-subunit alcohol dehydrogenase family)